MLLPLTRRVFVYAVLIAGGRGERLRPLTANVPKPMVPVAGKPIMQHQMEWYLEQGVDHFVISCGYLHEVIEAHFGNGSDFGAPITYAIEHSPLGRGGGLRQGMQQVPRGDELVLASNADIITEQNLDSMFTQHRADGNMATILLAPYISQFGIVELEGRKVSNFATNPVLPHWINGGIYVLDRAFEDHLPEIGDHEDSTFPDLASRGLLGAFKSEARWRGMDSVKAHANLEKELADHPLNYAGN